MHKTLIKNMDKISRTFCLVWWATKKKYHLVRWPKVCKSKKQGGLGIKDIMKLNLSLLCKWWWKLETEKGIWQDIIGAKYLSGQLISFVDQRHHDDSPIWADLFFLDNGKEFQPLPSVNGTQLIVTQKTSMP